MRAWTAMGSPRNAGRASDTMLRRTRLAAIVHRMETRLTLGLSGQTDRDGDQLAKIDIKKSETFYASDL